MEDQLSGATRQHDRIEDGLDGSQLLVGVEDLSQEMRTQDARPAVTADPDLEEEDQYQESLGATAMTFAGAFVQPAIIPDEDGQIQVEIQNPNQEPNAEASSKGRVQRESGEKSPWKGAAKDTISSKAKQSLSPKPAKKFELGKKFTQADLEASAPPLQLTEAERQQLRKLTMENI